MSPRDEEGQSARPTGPAAREGTRPAAGGEPSPAPPAGGPDGRDHSTQGPQAAGEEPSERVEHDLEALLKERDDYLELAKRTKADFENFRRRMSADVLAATGRGKAEVVREVLPVLDDLERALEVTGLDPEGDSEDALAHGVLLVFRGLREALGRSGVEPVDPKGERFDPTEHEALSTQAADGVESGVVVATMQKGYRLGEQLVRPARVVVSE